MHNLRQIFKYFRFKFGQHRAAQSRTITAVQSRPITVNLNLPICGLPLELILLIVDYLPVASGASLGLTCRYFHFYLRERCLESLKEAVHSRKVEFLHLLERDLPTSVVCPHCVQLHSMSFAKKYHQLSQTESRTTQPWLPCWCEDRDRGIEEGTYAGFSPIVFRMVMKAYRQLHETTQLLSLLGCGTKRIVDYGFAEQSTVAARIQDGSLLLRQQRIFIVPSSQEMPLPWFGRLDICPHFDWSSMVYLHLYGIQIPHANEIEGYENKQGLIYCNHCYTKFRIDFKSYGKAGNAMFLTKWMDLGEGRDWKDHKFISRFRRTEISWPKVDFRRGSICASFEQNPASLFKFDSLLSQQNQEDLCAENIKTLAKNIEVSFFGYEQYYAVRNGRVVLI